MKPSSQLHAFHLFANNNLHTESHHPLAGISFLQYATHLLGMGRTMSPSCRGPCLSYASAACWAPGESGTGVTPAPLGDDGTAALVGDGETALGDTGTAALGDGETALGDAAGPALGDTGVAALLGDAGGVVERCWVRTGAGVGVRRLGEVPAGASAIVNPSPAGSSAPASFCSAPGAAWYASCPCRLWSYTLKRGRGEGAVSYSGGAAGVGETGGQGDTRQQATSTLSMQALLWSLCNDSTANQSRHNDH
jgi:hypothetical protein